MNANALIEQQHREVEGLFGQIEGGKATPKIIEQLATLLTAHTAIEEQIYYPVAAGAKRQLVLESFEEHEAMASALKRFVACDPKDESFPARCKVLKELVMRHVREEEKELLPATAQSVPEEQLADLGNQMKARFDDVLALGYEGAVAARKTKRSTNGHRARGAASKTTATSKKKATPAAHHRKAA